jgi:hypothetical protein
MFASRFQNLFKLAFSKGSKISLAFRAGFSHSSSNLNPLNYLLPLVMIGGLSVDNSSQCFFNRSALKSNRID